MESVEQVDSRRAVEELKELADLTGGPEGARRVAWTDEWARPREWLRGSSTRSTAMSRRIEAGNLWAIAPGDSEVAVVLGDHIDSVPNGGWLDAH
jgi:N-carbamoyl-L-amino-acid hydrolase